MSKPNGRHGKRNIERLAEALQGCFDEAVETGTRRAMEAMEPRFGKIDETLRMIWTQCGGERDKRLPIDDSRGDDA